MTRPKLLDLFCCQGGAAEGYRRAGFDVYGVDIDPQPRYPFPFHEGDAIEVLLRLLAGEAIDFTHPNGDIEWLTEDEFIAKHASPPCQLYSKTHRINRSDFPDLIGPARQAFERGTQAWVIENVEEARSKLIDPVMLCGHFFGLQTYRHRLFESNRSMEIPQHPQHLAKTTKMGRRPVEGEFMHIVGNFSGVERGREVMEMPWASRDGLREAIPPAYTNLIGTQLIHHIQQKEAA